MLATLGLWAEAHLGGYRGPDLFRLYLHDGADRSSELTVHLFVGSWRSIHLQLLPDEAGPVRVEAVPLPVGDPVESPYQDGVGATIGPLVPEQDHVLLWVFSGRT